MENLNMPTKTISSYIVVSNDLTSKKIKVNKNTNIVEFYTEISNNFPDLNNMKLFYFEGYLKEKFVITNEEEYVIANKKGIEYFYTCGDKNDNDTTDFLKYYSVIVFSPVKSLNNIFQINDRKKMQMQKLEPINEIEEEADEIDNDYDYANNVNNILNQNLNNINQYNFNIGMNMNNMNNNFINNNIYFQGNPYFNNNMNNNINNFQLNNNFINNYMLMNNNNMMNNQMMKNNLFNNMNPLLFQNNQNFNNFNNNNIGINGFMNNFQNNNILPINYNMNNFNTNNNINNINNMNIQPMNNINLNNFNNNINNNFKNNFNIDYNFIPKNQPKKKLELKKEKEIPDYETIDTESDPVNKFIENAINYSSRIKHIITAQQKSNPDLFININETLKTPGLLSKKNPSKNDYKYILCLLGRILQNQGIKVAIYQKGNNLDRVDLSSIQFIFSGLISKKKYRLTFSQKYSEKIVDNLMEDSVFKKKFIEEWKEKISKILKIKKNLIILTNPRQNGEKIIFIDLAFNPNLGEINIDLVKELLVKGDIINLSEHPILGGCRLSPSIFNPSFNKYYKNSIPNQKRGGEEYIQPLNWTAYGINISQKFDFGNDAWLGNKNKPGEFAVAYYGINNLINNTPSKNVKSLMGNSQTGKTFIKMNNIRKPGTNCKSGAYFFNNPEFAENSSEKIKIVGVEYKVMFMCRVNPEKIMQPENFKDCWILSPTPDEVRPYKILIKKIPISPLAIASQQEIEVCVDSLPQLFFDIIQKKDESYFQRFNNKIDINNDKFKLILKEWTGTGSLRINNYLRHKKLSLTEKELQSNVWCLHKAITESASNVENNITVYRGVNVKMPNNVGIGTKFYFKEFLSTSKDIEVAQIFAGSGTLMQISIQNNGINGKKVYCRDIEKISQFSHEKEIIFTAFCQFIVTKIEKKDDLDIYYLTCDGFNF